MIDKYICWSMILIHNYINGSICEIHVDYSLDSSTRRRGTTRSSEQGSGGPKLCRFAPEEVRLH